MLGNASGFAIAILILLLLFSVLSWTIIFRKWLSFKGIRKKNKDFLIIFRKSPRLSEIGGAAEVYQGAPLSGIFTAGYEELNAQIKAATPHNPERPTLSARNFIGIERALQRASAAELSAMEKSMSWLATTAAVTPFIGLLGTVVGIINSFDKLGLGAGGASISAVAPGIAEALIATAAGLFAAIPAVIAYNQLVSGMKNIAAEMDDFSSEFLNLVERSFS